MTTPDQTEPEDDQSSQTEPEAGQGRPQTSVPRPRPTRASAAWAATGATLVLLTLLIVFILQNQSSVEVRFLGFTGTIPVGVGLMIAAVTGGTLVGIAGLARVLQLRKDVRRVRKARTQP